MGCGQDRYEQVLVDLAREDGADIRFGRRLVSFTQDDDGVTAVAARTWRTARRHTVRAAYLVGADGASSGTREQLGVGPHRARHRLHTR